MAERVEWEMQSGQGDLGCDINVWTWLEWVDYVE